MKKSEETVIMVTDGSYSGSDNQTLAKEKNVELITTSLSGREVSNIMADFEFNEEGTKVLQCPSGYEPKSCYYMKPSGQCRISFDRNHCVNCPYQDQCKPKVFKKVSIIITSKTASDRAKIQRKIQSGEYKNYSNLRNGVETVPSNLRRNYLMDKMPRDKQRGKFFFGCKIISLNFKEFFNYRKGLGNYAQNPVLA